MNSFREFTDYLAKKDFEQPFTLRNYTGFGAQTGEAGENLIYDKQLPLVQALKLRMGVKGFRTINGIKGTVSIPVQNTRQQVKFKTFHDGADETNPGFTKVTLTPHLLIGETRIGKDLLFLANDDVAAFVINQLTDQIAYKIEDYMLGKVLSGASNVVEYSALAAVDRDDMLEMEAKLGGYMINQPTYVVSPSTRAVLKGIKIDSGSGKFLCENNEINGYRCEVSGVMSADNKDSIYFGDWSKLILATWQNGIEILVDPYSYSSNKDVKIVASIGVDAAVEDGNAFCIGRVESSSSSSSANA